ncbi:hypothetical protein, partial [Burkholderia cepacia]|uniref:hypothetical protein n=1 Tax=Burkholderia cepacia TaxID=292 RepID=UPI001CF5DEAE
RSLRHHDGNNSVRDKTWLHWHLGDLDWKAAMLKQYGVGATLTIRFDQQPQFRRAALEQRQSAIEFEAEGVQPGCTARARRRNRPHRVPGIVHKIRALRSGFEVHDGS